MIVVALIMESCGENTSDCVKRDNVDTVKNFAILGLFFFLFTLILGCIYVSFPQLNEKDRMFVKLPRNVEDLKNLGRVLENYKHDYQYQVLAALLFSYLFLQTFAIPGSISLSILSGFLYPFPVALSLVCFCSATGASCCYFISYNFGRKLIYKYFPDKITYYSNLVQKHKNDMLSYIIFLRITPLLPNWFINISAPLIAVPFFPFWLGTFLGVAPPSFLAIHAGKTLHELTSIGGTWSWSSMILLFFFAVISLLPVLLKNSLKSKLL